MGNQNILNSTWFSNSVIKIYSCAVCSVDPVLVQECVNYGICGGFLENNFAAGPILLKEGVNYEGYGIFTGKNFIAGTIMLQEGVNYGGYGGFQETTSLRAQRCYMRAWTVKLWGISVK
jgi:hypothetical protein